MAPMKGSLPLRVSSCSRQGGKSRYHNKEDVEAPSIAKFRNNLTALSQYRNLLFVAYIDKIYVYAPSFPNQTINTKPELVIDLPRSRPGLRGHLDPSRPHAVNHLIAGDIGEEEIIVAACDDGDVISYTVRSISLAIDESAKIVLSSDLYDDRRFKRHRNSGCANLILPLADSQDFRALAPWFHENVGASAWGLALHKRAMLLAVSSNTKEINVFAPSLSHNRDRASRSECTPPKRMERYMACETRTHLALKDRSLGRKVVLRGHAANIPNIAFCDNSLDLEGTYLASTDVEGYTIVWDIKDGTRILETLGNAGPHARGWAVACLDPRSSRLSEGPVNTFGCACRVDESSTLIDNSEAGTLVHNNSQRHPGFSALGSVPGTLNIGTNTPAFQTVVQDAVATPADQDLEIGDEDEDEDEADGTMDETDDIGDASDEDPSDAEEGLGYTSFGESLVLLQLFEAAIVEQSMSNETSTLEDEYSDLPDLEEMPVAEPTAHQATEGSDEDSNTLFAGAEKATDRFSDTTHAKTCPNFVDLPFNLLQTDERDIHLVRDIRFDADLKRRPPDSIHSQVLCQQALNQRMPPGFNHLTQMERLNMIAQIPELGVVVIGNQVGRVGILTMTRWEAQKQSGYKIECILPFNSEEAKGLRPRKSLMGMAVSPVQGQETALPQSSPRMGARPPRRFRLLMAYCDHTILSYEISRPDEEDDILVV